MLSSMFHKLIIWIKKIIMILSGKKILPKDHYTTYNGVKVKWFIGDINFIQAKKIGFLDESGKVKSGGSYWHAWGCCGEHPYQLMGWYNNETRELSNVFVLPEFHEQEQPDGSMKKVRSPYFNPAVYSQLTLARK